MADYAPTNWQAEITKVGPTNLNKLEAGVADAATHHKNGTLANRPAAAAGNKNWIYTATDIGMSFLSDGALWIPLTGVPAVSVLPATPYEGQTVDLEVGPGAYWRFTFRSKAADGSAIAGIYRWFPAGHCPPLISEAPAFAQGDATGAYIDAPDGSQSVTVPAAIGGDFDVTVSGVLGFNGNGVTVYMSYTQGGIGANDADAASNYVWQNAAASPIYAKSTSLRARRKTGLSPATPLIVKYKAQAGVYTVEQRRIQITPVRCYAA